MNRKTSEYTVEYRHDMKGGKGEVKFEHIWKKNSNEEMRSTCRQFSRAYIRHLIKANEMLAHRLCVMHNLYFYNTMMTEIRDALDAGEFAAYKKRKLDNMAAGQ